MPIDDGFLKIYILSRDVLILGTHIPWEKSRAGEYQKYLLRWNTLSQ